MVNNTILPEELFADLVLLNGKIVTMDDNDLMVEAVACKGENIIKVGSNEEVGTTIGKHTKVLNLKRKTVIPGFIEIHVHAALKGTCLVNEVDVGNAKSISELLKLIKKKAEKSPKGEWVRAVHYDDRKMSDNRHPTRWDLDEVAPNHLVYVQRLDYHMGVANSKLLQYANITKDIPDPFGGKIVKDPETGEPTGLLMERASQNVRELMPKYSINQIKEGIQVAQKQLAEWGITSYNEAMVTRDELVAYQELLTLKKLPLRVGLIMKSGDIGQPATSLLSSLKTIGIQIGFGNNRLKIVGTKFICDGSMSGWTAALNEPYENDLENRGMLLIKEEKLTEQVVEAHMAGLRPCIHAIGDRAIEVTLNAIEVALKEKFVNDHRIRIEHCSLPTEEQLEKIKHLGVFPSSSIGFIWELGAAHLQGIGTKRAKRYFPHKSFLDYDIISAGNSDWGVTKADPLQQIYGAVTRRTHTGDHVGPEQAVSIMDAIRLYTINAAYANFEEDIKGSIEPGKLADMIILDKNILTSPEEEIKNIKVLKTIVGGKIIYEKE